jgi:hypothetical protein
MAFGGLLLFLLGIKNCKNSCVQSMNSSVLQLRIFVKVIFCGAAVNTDIPAWLPLQKKSSTASKKKETVL